MPLEKKYRELFNLIEVEDFLQLRIFKTGCKIEDLFLVVKIPDDMYEIDYMLETRYGRLKVFFCTDPDLKGILLLHKSKFNYPTSGFLSDLRNRPTQLEKVEQELVQQQLLKEREEEEEFGKQPSN